jgi:hypothetical protein
VSAPVPGIATAEFATTEFATVEQLWRYPVKSMLGEPLTETEATERGLPGDRSLALTDLATGKIASAKAPRLWRALLHCRATTKTPPLCASPCPAARNPTGARTPTSTTS